MALVDVNAAMVALRAAHPDWTTTADLMLHEAAPLVKGPAILESAAEAAVPGCVASDIHIHYLAGARTGPVRTSAVVVRDTDDHVVCRIEAVDVGADNPVLALATVTLQTTP